jgi:PAS domain S-box-containing protein
MKIIVGGDRDFPPYEFLENGNPTGFNIDLIRAVADVTDLDIEIRLGPWSKIRQDLEQGRIDLVTGMVYSEARSKLLDFSVPHTMISPGLFVRTDSPVRTLADIRGKEIIVQENDIMHDFLRTSGLTQRIITVADPSEALRLLASGKYDGALLSSRIYKYSVVGKFGFNNLKEVKTDLPPQRYCFAVAKRNSALLYKLNQGLVILKSTGMYQKIYDKWFGVYEEKPWWQTIKYFVFSLAAIAALLLASLVWSWSLKQQVNKKTAEIKQAKEVIDKRLIALTSPPETTDISFFDLFNIENIQKIQDTFAELANVASIITHPDGTPITKPSNFCRLCKDIIRKTDKGLTNCFSSDSIIGRYNPDGPVIQQCLSGGLWDAGASITVGGKHIANWLIGQVKNEATDEKQMLGYAREIGADEEEFRKALQEVPVMSHDRFRKIAEALFLFANELSLKAYQNVQQARLITEREQMADELRKAHAKLEQRVQERTAELFHSRQMLELVLDNIPQRVFWKDINSIYVGCNKSLAQDSGFDDPEELVGKNDFDMAWADTAELYRADDKHVMETGLPKINYEEPQKKSDGSTFWLRTTKVPLRDKDGRIIGVLGTYEDITDKKKAEEALRESEEKYRTLVDNVSIGVFRIDGSSSGRLLQANPALSAFSGYTHEELLRLSLSDVYQYPQQREDIAKELRKKGFARNKEVVLKKKDGSLVWASLSLTALYNEQGSIQWIDGVGEDITERKRAEEILAQRTAELERSNRELEHFASIASHDLKAPLSTISGFAELLQERYADKLDETARQALAAISKGTQTMNALIRDILAYARVTSSGESFKPVRCADVVNSALMNLQADIKEHGAVITSDDMPVVQGDEMQFVQLFQNLIGNALKYRGEQSPRIHLSAKRLDDPAVHSELTPGWLFSVEDNGIGIDPAHFDQVFVLFKRVHQDSTDSGTGLGLAICKKIVEGHNGRIWVESSPGKGSTFSFTIPDRPA